VTEIGVDPGSHAPSDPVPTPEAYDVAGICAHPDDAELTMGGTLAREASRGRRVALVDLTRGEAGSRGTPELRAQEAHRSARILGVAHRECVGLPDGGLASTTEQRDAIVAVLRRLRPRVVLLQHAQQRHPDHASASQLVYDAAYIGGLRHYRPDLGVAFRPFKLLYAVTMTEARDVRPTLVVDVTSTWNQKLQAIQAFESQFTPSSGEHVKLPFDGFRDAVELMGRRHGQLIGVRYGEGFVSHEPVEVSDLAELSVSSF